jgi:Fe-S-cluster containining protein
MDEAVALEICRKCQASCCKFGGADFTGGEMRRVLDAGYPNYFVKINENHYEMKSERGTCPYLKSDYSCLIHDVRPLVCKSFPVYVVCKNNETEFCLIACPLSAVLSKNDIEVMKEQASQAEEIILTTFSDSKLPKRDLELIEKRFSKFKMTTV